MSGTQRFRRRATLLIAFHSEVLLCREVISGRSLVLELELLQLLAACREWVGVTDIARVVGRPEVQVAVDLKTLAKAGFLDTDASFLQRRHVHTALECGWDLCELAVNRTAKVFTEGVERSDLDLMADGQHRVCLPRPSPSAVSLAIAFRQRRSIRQYGSRLIDDSQIATILGMSFTPTAQVSESDCAELRVLTGDAPAVGAAQYAHPTAGALGILTAYLAVGRVEGVQPGLYEYQPAAGDDDTGHALCRISSVSFFEFRKLVFPDFEWADDAAAILVISADVSRLSQKYRHPYVLSLLEVGHLSQNVQLACTAADVACCALGTLDEDSFLGFGARQDYGHVPLLSIALGSLRV